MLFGSETRNNLSLHIELGEIYVLVKSFAYRMAHTSPSKTQTPLCQYHQRQSSSSSTRYRLID